jgi:hypothetical protein
MDHKKGASFSKRCLNKYLQFAFSFTHQIRYYTSNKNHINSKLNMKAPHWHQLKLNFFFVLYIVMQFHLVHIPDMYL